MTTDDRFLSASQGKILGVQDFRERLISYLRNQIIAVHQTAFGLDGTFGGTLNTLSAYGADRIQINGDYLMADGAGHFLQTDSVYGGRDVGLAFENANGVTYYVALHYAERPRGIQINAQTGVPEYSELEEVIGDLADPNSVTNNGATITFRVDSVADPIGSSLVSHAGRRCYVWRKVPAPGATTEAIAIELCTITWTGTENRITTTGLLGQATGAVSTVASDYSVLMLGATISRVDLAAEPAYAFIGTVVGVGAGLSPSTFSLSGQNDLSSGFAVDLNQITRLVNGDLKIRVRAVPADSDEAQLEVQDAGGSTVFSVDEDGDTVIAGDLTVVGTTTLAALAITDLTVTGNATIGDANTDSHVFRGRVRHQYDSGGVTTGIDIDGATGEIGLGGAPVSGQRLKTYGAITLGNATSDVTQILSELLCQFPGDLAPRLRFFHSGSGAGLLSLNVDTDFSSALRVAGQVRLQENLLLGETFAGGIAGFATIPRIDFGTLNTLAIINTLMAWTSGSTQGRLHSDSFGASFVYTHNARWNVLASPSPAWQKDVTGVPSLQVRLGSLISSGGGYGLEIRLRLAANDTAWADTAWDRTYYIDVQNLITSLTGALVLGADRLASAADVGIARVQAAHAESAFAVTSNIFTKLAESLSTVAARQGFRLYAVTQGADANNDAGLYIVVNASYNQATDLWTKDDSDKPALALRLNGWSPGAGGSSEIEILSRIGNLTGTWNRTGWTAIARVRMPDHTASPRGPRIEIEDGYIRFLNNTTNNGTFAAPTSSMLANTLYARMLPKARAVVETDGAGGVTIVGGFGLASAVLVSNELQIVTQQSIDHPGFDGMIGLTAGATPVSADLGQVQHQDLAAELAQTTFNFAVWNTSGVVNLSGVVRRITINFWGD